VDEYKAIVHRELFMLVYKGGSFSYTDVYNMPVHYRRLYLKLLEEALTNEAKAVDESINKNKKPSSKY